MKRTEKTERLVVIGNGTAGIACVEQTCKPALSYILDMLWCGDHDEDPSTRFINDRVQANIQNDRSFSVVPPIRRDMTSPEELRRREGSKDEHL